ncbi:hypothetical protein HDU80_006929 [Chytriomyces hyalinus]|nr:hypothetical protein HDU80_006929 [Chytriomyces hyalinus]
MIVKITCSPNASGFVIGSPGLDHSGVTVEGVVHLSFGKAQQHVELLSVSLEAFIKTPKDGVARSSTNNTTSTTLLQMTANLIERNKPNAFFRSNNPAHNPVSLFQGSPSKAALSSQHQQRPPQIRQNSGSSNSPSLLSAATTVKQSESFRSASPSGASVAATSRTMEFPFSFTLNPDTVANLPPSIQLSPSGPSNGSPYGLRYVLKAVCKYSGDEPSFSKSASPPGTVYGGGRTNVGGTSGIDGSSSSSESAHVFSNLYEAGLSAVSVSNNGNVTSNSSNGGAFGLLLNGVIGISNSNASSTASQNGSSAVSVVSNGTTAMSAAAPLTTDRFKVATDQRIVTWSDFRESNLVAVMKNKILGSWMDSLVTTIATVNAHSGIREDDLPSLVNQVLGVSDVWMHLRSPQTITTQNQLHNSPKLDGKESLYEHYRNSIHHLITHGAGNPIRRIQRCSVPERHTAEGKPVVVVGAGGWMSAVEFESDTICYGDRRYVKFRILEPEYYEKLRDQEGRVNGYTDVENREGMEQDIRVRRGTAQFEVILVESWNWVGMAEKSGSREIKLLELSEEYVDEFGEEQMALITFPDFLLPSIRVPHIHIYHKLIFRFVIPQSLIRPANRVPDFGHASSIIPREPRSLAHINSFSALKASVQTQKSFTDLEHTVSTAAIKVASFSRSDAEFLFENPSKLPESILSLLPNEFIARARAKLDQKNGSNRLAGGHLHPPQQYQRSRRASTTSSNESSFILGQGASRSSMDSVHSNNSAKLASTSAPVATNAPAFGHAKPSSTVSSFGSVTSSTSTAIPTTASPTSKPSMMRSISTNGRFGLLSNASSQKNPAPVAGGVMMPKLPLPSVASAVSGMAPTNSSMDLRSASAASSTHSGGGKQLVSTMDLQLCDNLSKSGFL